MIFGQLMKGRIRIICKKQAYNWHIIFITKMLVSDNNGLSHLLGWVNNEWNLQGHSTTFYDFQQLKRTAFIYDMLQKINPSYFQGLNHLSYHFQTYFQQLENYLIEIEGKKMKRGYKRALVQQQPVSEIIKLVLYLLLQSPHKTQFINRIFEMPVEIQSFLMIELKTVDQALENYIEIKDILMTVQKLEEENEELKDKLKIIGQNSKQLQQTVTETRIQNVKIEKEIHKYEFEKKLIMDELHISDMRDYIEIYKAVRQQNEDLGRYINETENRRREIQAENTALKDRISEDCQTITTLNDQIQKIKSNYVLARDEVSLLTSSQRHSFEDSVLRENKNLNNTSSNTNVKQSSDTSCTVTSSKILWELDHDEDTENQHLRNYNREIMEKLENAYRTISELTDQVLQLKQEKSKLQKKNRFLDKKVTDIKKEQSRFMKELKNIGF